MALINNCSTLQFVATFSRYQIFKYVNFVLWQTSLFNIYLPHSLFLQSDKKSRDVHNGVVVPLVSPVQYGGVCARRNHYVSVNIFSRNISEMALQGDSTTVKFRIQKSDWTYSYPCLVYIKIFYNFLVMYLYRFAFKFIQNQFKQLQLSFRNYTKDITENWEEEIIIIVQLFSSNLYIAILQLIK